jgi:hypothetical protein
MSRVNSAILQFCSASDLRSYNREVSLKNFMNKSIVQENKYKNPRKVQKSQNAQNE